MRTRTTIALLATAVAGCGSIQTLGTVDAPSRNQNSRVNYIVIHFTTEDFADSLALLTEPSDNPVSSHYLIPEPGDESYGDRPLRVFRLVDESRRAWHAGRSYWDGEEALNDRSIGIELVNRSYCVEEPDDPPLAERLCFYPDYAPEQIALLIDLVQRILERHPEIDPVDVVGHADIAPERKVDPGPRFPWQLLHRAGIGAWYEDDTVVRYRARFDQSQPSLTAAQKALRAYGYPIEPTGEDDVQSRAAFRAFQMHFLPATVTGQPDAETMAVLFALIERYRGEALEPLLDELAAEPPAADEPPTT